MFHVSKLDTSLTAAAMGSRDGMTTVRAGIDYPFRRYLMRLVRISNSFESIKTRVC